MGNAIRHRNARLFALASAVTLSAALLAALPPAVPRAGAAPDTIARISDLTLRPGDVPRRLVGYGIVVGLDGTGDRSFGRTPTSNPTVHSVLNLLRRFEIEIPSEQLRPRNVAAVLVTAEVSPWLRSGGRFEVQVSALGDATSLRGGVLWITPLVTDPGQPAIATAQGAIFVAGDETGRVGSARRGNTARTARGGILEVDSPTPAPAEKRLLLREPDRLIAASIAAAINGAYGEGTARADDPGSVSLAPPAGQDTLGFLAAIDTLAVAIRPSSRVVINGREGTVVAGAEVRVADAVVHHRGITLEVGGAEGSAAGIVHLPGSASVRDVAAGLHAAGARPDEMAAIFEALQASGALRAEVVIR
ncbi:MAG: flagellar basal body P-ring protein FlgI [Candidatus Eisenbacteria bacterium]|nr:flagellar basal body P-ring protein FlgI [Candidatus Eisenbacteria bacterium]